uniref:Tricalbin-1 n=1 Tax=Hemiscolopendra marginata TaxID=943146 RepID=A0A646QE25_9MYRI
MENQKWPLSSPQGLPRGDDGDLSPQSPFLQSPMSPNQNETTKRDDVVDKGDRKEPEGAAVEPKETGNNDFEEELLKKSQRETQFVWSNIFLSLTIIGSWILGQAGLSVAWIVLLLGLFYVVWQGKLIRLIEETVVFEKLRIHRRRALQTAETAEWLNFIINRWWIFSSHSIFSLVKNSLDPLLNDAKPSFLESIQLSEFTLGDATPVFKSIKAFDVTSGEQKPLTLITVAKPLADLAHSVKCQLALETEVGLHCPDYRLVLNARVGGKGVGVDLDVAMEKLNISGKLNIAFHLSMECPFPHITKISFTFIDKPEIWFNLRILKTVQMMEVPILKTWVHSLVTDALTTALVDPGKFDLNLHAAEGLIPSSHSRNSLVQGVLTITLSRSVQQINKLSTFGDEERWCVIRLGDQRQVTSKLNSVRWQECRSFLVENLSTDKVLIKVKSKRLISTITLMQFELPLLNYSFDNGNKIVETVLQKKSQGKGYIATPALNVRMEYTLLPSIKSDLLVDEISMNHTKSNSGVMYICIHGATDLVAPDRRGIPNPYCIILCNRKKIKTTHYVSHTLNPKWEACIEFLVADYLQMVISFAVCNWDVNKMVDSDLLGLGSLAMKQDEAVIQKRQIPLTFNISSNSPENEKDNGFITVTAVFRPVPSVGESDESQLLSPINNNPDDDDDDDIQPLKNRKNTSSNFMQTAKMLLSNTKDQEAFNSVDFGDILSSGSGLMELNVIRAQNLEAKDLNGFSDPYCEVKINDDCKFKTSCKKKTLNPEWEESVTTQLPKDGDTLAVILWDRDPLGMKDFLGSVTLTLDEIRQHSAKDCSEWFALKSAESGEIELKIKIISEDLEINGSPCGPPATLSCDLIQENLRPFPPTIVGRTLPLAVPSPILPKKVAHSKIPTQNNEVKDLPKQNLKEESPAKEVRESHVTSLSNSDKACVIPEALLPTESLPSSQTTQENNHSLSDSNQKIRNSRQYSSIRSMKQKMKDGFSHPLRRFRSEVNVHENRSKNLQERVTVEPQNPAVSTDSFDNLIHTKSQPDISSLIPVSIDINGEEEKKSHYFNVQGKILQGLGFKAEQNLIYCRIRFSRNLHNNSKFANGKTICKSSMIPASINPRFDTEFQIDTSSGLSKSSALTFEIRSDKKETISSKTLTLDELFGDCSRESAELQKWIVLSNGTKLEVEISHGKPFEKKSGTAMKLFRSWSVHRIGKI